MIKIAIDGACRRNGKPNCVAAGGLYIDNNFDNCHGHIYSTHAISEHNSTNQRGEMLALLKALEIVVELPADEVYIITDSEYLFNAMTKKWYASWMAYGWKTSSGSVVKNCDLWQRIVEILDGCAKHEIIYYHIKGHCIPFGKVTAEMLLRQHRSGRGLQKEVAEKFDNCLTTKADVFESAQALSEKNNGFRLPPEVFKDFVVLNVVADAVATVKVEEADREI